MWIRNAASGGTTAIQTYPSTQQRQGRVDGPELPRGNVGVVAAQASDPLSQPPQNQPADLARQYAIARDFVLGLLVPEMVVEASE